MSQCDEILSHLRNRGPLTGAEAYRLYGCMRLPARVSDCVTRDTPSGGAW